MYISEEESLQVLLELRFEPQSNKQFFMESLEMEEQFELVAPKKHSHFPLSTQTPLLEHKSLSEQLYRGSLQVDD